MPNRSLAEALVAHAQRATEWGDKMTGESRSGRLNVNANATDAAGAENPVAWEARYGFRSWNRKRSGRGENLVIDWITDPPMLAYLNLPDTYRLTPEDINDLRMMPAAYAWLQGKYRELTGLEPGKGTPVEQPWRPADPKPQPSNRQPDPSPGIPADPPLTVPTRSVSPLDVRADEIAVMVNNLINATSRGPAILPAPITGSALSIMFDCFRDRAWPLTKPFVIAALRLYRALTANSPNR